MRITGFDNKMFISEIHCKFFTSRFHNSRYRSCIVRFCIVLVDIEMNNLIKLTNSYVLLKHNVTKLDFYL